MGSPVSDLLLALVFIALMFGIGFQGATATTNGIHSAQVFAQIVETARTRAPQANGATVILEANGSVWAADGETTNVQEVTVLRTPIALVPDGGARFTAGALFVDPDGTVRTASGVAPGGSVAPTPQACLEGVTVETTGGDLGASIGCNSTR